ncbi:hypothetical protein OGAPHI_001324 [Ogataea philodendri]|uniref:beta-glucosidase n=1 Tax=Ogataea philodendri TaxID=1378263 RepID=A0A9P8PEJ2_9ASCO|nr:uncharacterized protein OGAPHI_001324 [Ogataea philodendri]KAH3670808.1 hypothetical protein OGAPHI_001324 [Ogataea philodendri]
MFDVEEVLSKLSLGEKVSLLSGEDFWHTKPLDNFGVPSIRVSDGPNGIRGTKLFDAIPASCIPCGTGIGAMFDKEFVSSIGKFLAAEAKLKGVNVVLGPTVNIARGPLGGRGFESFSEDPVLSGLIAAQYIKGLQSENVFACLKHYVCNDMEHERKASNTIVTERALREQYLLPFLIALKESNPRCLMTSYNKVNGTHVSESPFLIGEILRKEWGFDGLIMSDWFGTYSVSESLNAGLGLTGADMSFNFGGIDLEMPGPGQWRGSLVSHSVTSNKVNETTIDMCARNVLRLVKDCQDQGMRLGGTEECVVNDTKLQSLRDMAAKSIVLLKNEDNVLPLNKRKGLLVIGPNAKFAAYCGGGSAALTTYHAVTPYEGLKAQLDDESLAHYAPGCYSHKMLPLMDDKIKTKDGEPGFIFKFYTQPHDVVDRVPFDTFHLRKTHVYLSDYKHEAIRNNPVFYGTTEGYFTPEESGVYDFGLCVRGTAKLFIDDVEMIDNESQQTQGTSFMNNGTVEEKAFIELTAGRTYKISCTFGSGPTSKLISSKAVIFGGGGISFGCAKQIDEEQTINQAAQLAAKADQVVVVIGLSEEWECEGFDRATMDLPGKTDQLVREVLKANPNAVIVNQSGTPVTMSWASQAKAIVQSWYGGTEMGNGLADVLFGNVNPSAKLPLSFPVKNEDNPAFLNFENTGGRVLYGEDIYVGYKYYEKTRKKPLFAFGHGLSYSKFEFSDPEVDLDDEFLVCSCDVRNVSSLSGSETIQIYIGQLDPSQSRPVKDLRDFTKVHLNPNETKRAVCKISLKVATSTFDELTKHFKMSEGNYEVLFGVSSDKIVLREQFKVQNTIYWKGFY